MLKKLIQDFEIITTYLATSILATAFFVSLTFITAYTQSPLHCFVSLGSNQTEICPPSDYIIENLFYFTSLYIMIQSALIPLTILSFFIHHSLKIFFPKIEKLKLWQKYLLAIGIWVGIVAVAAIIEDYMTLSPNQI